MNASASSRRNIATVTLLRFGILCALLLLPATSVNGEASHHVSSEHLDTLVTSDKPITNVLSSGVEDALSLGEESHLRRRRNDEVLDNIFTFRKGGGGGGGSSSTSKSKSKSAKQKSRSSGSKRKSASDQKEEEAKKRKKRRKKKSRSGTDHKSSERMCRTSKEKSCRNSCIDKSCDRNDREDSPCYKRCRYNCCSDSTDSSSKKSDKTDKKKSDSSSDDRMCSTMAEKSCRTECFVKKDCNGRDECEKGCRYDCCRSSRSDKSKSQSKQKSKSKDGSKAKTDGSKTSKKSKDDDSKRKSKDDDSKKKKSSKKSDKSDDDKSKNEKNKNKRSSKDKSGTDKSKKKKNKSGGSGMIADDSDDNDEPLCNTDAENKCKKDCYEEFSCESGDKECRRTCRKDCCDRNDSSVSVLDLLGADGDDMNNENGMSSVENFTGDLPVPFRFTINTSSGISATDILFARGNDLKRDMEGGLDLLVSEVVGEKFQNSDWKENKRFLRRRQLLVQYQSRSCSVEDVVDVPCPLNSVQSGACRRVSAEATLSIVDENTNDVRQAFLPTISDAIRSGRLEEKIREYNPDHGSQLLEEEGGNSDSSTRSESDSNGGMSNLLIAGIAVAGFVALVLAYLGFRELQDRKKRKHDRSLAESSAYDTTHQDGYGNPADSQAQYTDQGGCRESTSGPPIPPPPQLPDRSSAQLSQVRQELKALEDSQYEYERRLEKGGPSISDLVESSYSPRVTQDAYDGDDRGGYHRGESGLSEISEEYPDGGNPAHPGGNIEASAGSIDNYGDYDEPNQVNEDPTSPDIYRDRDGGNAALDMPDQPQEQEQEYYEQQQEGEEDDAHYHYQEQEMVTNEDNWDEQKQEVYEEGEYEQEFPDPTVATYTTSGYESESPPDAAESDVSGGNEDDYTDSSSQRYVAMAKKMADEEEPSSRRESEHEDAIERISDGDDDEETAHSQAKAYRVRAQADKIGRKSQVSELINRFESP
eukprot:CAMPEP_0178480738 /NCGR_PEP_ID=MMETSP0696-20121128/5853_1 /TAXON_ID=265572 /ORGANISM="Extubocellulus spinifer, Strain CCMP396" /LENGTH=982 /DNA_ID=CAMNT_0020108193 /DNA_START=174 /DNA_END=3122 /DNA_ORIENTATION=+